MGNIGSGSMLNTYFNGGTYFNIQLDFANFHEGSMCTGTINFQLTQPQPFLEVYVAIQGHEYVRWYEQRSSGTGEHRRTYTVTITDMMECCNQRFMVMKAPNSFAPGQYSYPISFQLPVGLPGSYVHQSGVGNNSIQCSVSYNLYCELQNGSAQIGRAVCPIVIMQQPRTPFNHDVPIEITKAVKTWCCCAKGNVNVKAIFEKDVVRMNETVAMRFNADLSMCKVDVIALKAVLKRNLTLRTRQGNHNYRINPMITVPSKGVRAGDKSEDIVAIFDLSKATDLGTPSYLTGSLGEFAGKIQQTCNGTLVSCTYELQVMAEIDGTICCDQNPTAALPVEILAPEKMIAFFAVIPMEAQPVDPMAGMAVAPDAYGQAPAPEYAPAPGYAPAPAPGYAVAPSPSYAPAPAPYPQPSVDPAYGAGSAPMGGAQISSQPPASEHHASIKIDNADGDKGSIEM